MDYSTLQNKITCGESESILSTKTIFRYDGHDENIIKTWLSDKSILKVLICWIKSKLHKNKVQTKSVQIIDSHKKYEEHRTNIIKKWQERYAKT